MFELINKNTCKIIDNLSDRRYLNELAEITKIKSKNNLLKNLRNLSKANVIIIEKNRSNTFYSLNYNNPLTIAILNLINMFKFDKLPFDKKSSVLEIVSDLKPLIAILFGSTAKLNYSKGSDIDILIVTDDNINYKEKIREFSEQYGVKINPILISIQDFEKKDESLIHILKTGYPLTGEIFFYNELKKI
jgi:predicted nucleotidyltransferase